MSVVSGRSSVVRHSLEGVRRIGGNFKSIAKGGRLAARTNESHFLVVHPARSIGSIGPCGRRPAVVGPRPGTTDQ